MERSHVRGHATVATIVCTLCCLLSWRKQPVPSAQTQASIPAPPDLSSCMRLKTRYLPSAMDCLFRRREQRELLSLEESAHLHSAEHSSLIGERALKPLLASWGARRTWT
jgi:hypothetical protein